MSTDRDDLAKIMWIRRGVRGNAWATDACRADADAILASDWLAQRDRRVAAEALRSVCPEIRDAASIPVAARAAICAVLRGRAGRIERGEQP